MAGYNKVILMGNLTRDPQLSFLPSQTPVCEIGMAVNRRWRDKDGQQRDEVCFIDCRAYGRQAETINQYMKKGRQILIEGRLQFDQWETQDGQKRSKHRVTISNFQFVGTGQGQGRGPGGPPPTDGYDSAPAAPPAQAGPPPPDDMPGPGSEDIPF